ncbi:hypothetical protein GQ53DRAFT_817006 [Thozetella sp. PMI_491]|nr:hypothetical protein GQ53DRAFT_817006 [Thozetella sp. PMI_491]
MESIKYVATASLFSAAALLSQTHFAHAIFGTKHCNRRTDTRTTLAFRQAEKPAEEVIFDFSRNDPGSVDVTIPVGSGWVDMRTFHFQQSNCMTILTLDGWTSLFHQSIFRGSGSSRFGKGVEFPQRPLVYLEWRREGLDMPKSRSVVRLFDHAQLWRTQCSVILDAERYFSLCTTPVWIRVLFSLVSYLPGSGGKALRDAMINAALYIQLRLIFHVNDTLTDQGYIYIDWLWWTTPQWVWEFQGQSAIAISKIVVGLYYWVGRLLLSMKPEYDEYNVILGSVEKNEKQ